MKIYRVEYVEMLTGAVLLRDSFEGPMNRKKLSRVVGRAFADRVLTWPWAIECRIINTDTGYGMTLYMEPWSDGSTYGCSVMIHTYDPDNPWTVKVHPFREYVVAD